MSAATKTRVSPLPAKVRSSPRSARDRSGISPNYFSPIISTASKPSNPQAPEFEAFRRQSESNSFNLGHGNLTYFSTSSGSRNASDGASSAGSCERVTPVQSPVSQPVVTNTMEKEMQIIDHMDIDQPSPFQTSAIKPHTPFSLQSVQSSTPSFFDLPRNQTPPQASTPELASLRRNQLSTVDERHPRHSLPNNRIDPPSPAIKGHSIQRAETLPDALSAEGPKLISPQELRDVLDSHPSEAILLLDVRVYPQYLQSRIDGALNLCIPTTLLKRPAFNVQKLAETFTKEKEKAKFAQWREAKVIVVYDATSSLLKDATSSVNTLKKFTAEGWRGLPCIVRGGFLSFSRKSPDLIDRRPANEMESAQGRKLLIDPQRPLVAPVAGGCLMPSNQNAANPFFGSIRQNMDLIGGVGQMPLKVSQYLQMPGNRYLPLWLKKVSDERDAGRIVADRFLQIEKGEQQRMQKALSGAVYYGSPSEISPNAVRIAGIEKGTKNRYKDILPYDHTRVRLKGVPPGECDYINASHIKSFSSNRRYIASQAPVPATIEVHHIQFSSRSS
jgi:rhodanese-related sulfurtransferase